MVRSNLFRGGLNDFSMSRCANCDGPMHMRYGVTIKGEKVKVCSMKCEDELRVKHNDPRKPIKFKPSVDICPRCGGEMGEGQALTNTAAFGVRDFEGSEDLTGQTFSYTGPPVMIEVSKCKACGYSRI